MYPTPAACLWTMAWLLRAQSLYRAHCTVSWSASMICTMWSVAISFFFFFFFPDLALLSLSLPEARWLSAAKCVRLRKRRHGPVPTTDARAHTHTYPTLPCTETGAASAPQAERHAANKAAEDQKVRVPDSLRASRLEYLRTVTNTDWPAMLAKAWLSVHDGENLRRLTATMASPGVMLTPTSPTSGPQRPVSQASPVTTWSTTYLRWRVCVCAYARV